jgi:hypothetical protein
MVFKFIVISLLLIILISLGTALFSLVKTKPDADSDRTVKALTIRIGLSIALIVLLIVGQKLGLISPHNI